jgi:bifunctional ADP-heptose synthase (sugar kinase/adenylyltransferase)
LGAKVSFISVTGNDEPGKFAQQQLENAQVESVLFIDETRPTTLKQRYRSKGKSLLRVSYLHQDEISQSLQKKILDTIESKLSEIDLFVFSDFNYGCLPQLIGRPDCSLAENKKHHHGG